MQRILYFRGASDRYLQQPSGVATHNILRLSRPELYPSLKTSIERVFSTNEAVTVTAYVKTDVAGLQPFTLIVQPMVDPETKARCALVLFKDGSDGQVTTHPPPTPSETNSEATQALSQELALTKEYLQSTIEEIERTNQDHSQRTRSCSPPTRSCKARTRSSRLRKKNCSRPTKS